jgi:hypothetical protein
MTKRRFVHEYTQENDYNPNQWRGSSLSKRVLKTWLFKDYIFIKMSLDNYDGLTGPREYV